MELKAFERTQNLTALRADGMLPAVVYDKSNNHSVYVERKAFDRLFRQASTHGVITLAFPDGKKLDTLVKAVAMNKRKRIVEHADFLIVSDEPVEVSVPVRFKGTAKGVKEQGGVIDVIMHTVVIKASPKSIPPELLADVTEVGLNQPVHASDLVLPAGVTLITDAGATVLTIHPPRAEEAALAAEAAAAAEPEVIAKGKKEEE